MNREHDITPDQIDACMIHHRARLRGMLRRIRHRRESGNPCDCLLADFRAELNRSTEIARRRQRAAPTPAFEQLLPIHAFRQTICDAIREHQVVVICGETGSGKSTQLPQFCIELGRGVTGIIGHTQPRRIAARSVAARIAQELKVSLGGQVGFKVRFSDKTSPHTFVKVMTDGILLNETQSDRLLNQYDTLLIDEAHERSLNIDFLLGYLKRLAPKRRDLKLIITSATIDPQRFSEYFGGAPIVEVGGRTFPVEVCYRPEPGADRDKQDRQPQQAIIDAVAELDQIDRGDILVFLSGEREIRETAQALRQRHLPNTEVCPLYARLSASEQMKVFQPHPNRRILLATNVAETSLTVPGVRHVVDTGLARISRYSARAKVQRLPVELISQSSCDQRLGRCGRTREGVCIRLYSEQDYLSRGRFTSPEILRTNLAAVLLQMKALSLPEPEAFEFMDRPKQSMIREGRRTLHEIGAVDDTGKLNKIGRQLVKLPIDPRIGRMIVAGKQEDCLADVLIIASALSIQDPRERPQEAESQADAAHAALCDEQSDFLSFLKLWDFFHEQARNLSKSQLRKCCRQNFLSYLRMRQWQDTHRQVANLIAPKRRPQRGSATPEQIHRALLAGLLAHIGYRGEGREYIGTDRKIFHIFPGSVLFKKRPRWIVAAELVETSRLYARTVAPIHSKWLERLAPHLVKKSHGEPRWQPASAHVVADEKVSLYGLTIVPRRTVHFGPINPKLAREIFIHYAFVEGDYGRKARPAPFFAHNRQLQAQVEKLEAKARRHDLLVNENARFSFYDERIPNGIYDGPSFDKWRKQAEKKEPNRLYMNQSDLLTDANLIDEDQYPDHLKVGDSIVALEYRAESGHPRDGVTAIIGPELLNQISEVHLSWLVPGLLREKVVELIRSLPKPLRRNFVPIPDMADRCLSHMKPQNRALEVVLAEQLGKLSGVAVTAQNWQLDLLPRHLQMNLKVIDPNGKVLDSGRDLGLLRAKLSEHIQESFHRIGGEIFRRRQITKWDFGELSPKVEIQQGGTVVLAYPALVDEGRDVSLELFDCPHTAQWATRGGLRRLFALQVGEQFKHQIQALDEFEQMSLHFATLGTAQHLAEQLALLIIDRAYVGDGQDIRTAADFEAHLDAGWHRSGEALSSAVKLIEQVLVAYHQVSLALTQPAAESWGLAIEDVRDQLSRLLSKQFLVQTPHEWLVQFPRYLGAIQRRLQKLANGGLVSDQRRAAELRPHWQAYLSRIHQDPSVRRDPALEHYRWMIEEFRVGLFAQELGTAMPVSAKRLIKQWEKVVAWASRP